MIMEKVVSELFDYLGDKDLKFTNGEYFIWYDNDGQMVWTNINNKWKEGDHNTEREFPNYNDVTRVEWEGIIKFVYDDTWSMGGNFYDFFDKIPPLYIEITNPKEKDPHILTMSVTGVMSWTPKNAG